MANSISIIKFFRIIFFYFFYINFIFKYLYDLKILFNPIPQLLQFNFSPTILDASKSFDVQRLLPLK